jgi:hypothetical protein
MSNARIAASTQPDLRLDEARERDMSGTRTRSTALTSRKKFSTNLPVKTPRAA